MSVELLRRKFTVEEYQSIARAGIFTQSDRLELIAGEIVEMPRISPRHAACIRRLINLFNAKLAIAAMVDSQNSVVLNDTSQPQPDVVLLKPRADFYEQAYLRPADCFLLVEVADSSINCDREIKIPLYAANGVIEAWLVDLNGEAVEVYRQPGVNGYENMSRLSRVEMLTVGAFADVSLTVDEVLG